MLEKSSANTFEVIDGMHRATAMQKLFDDTKEEKYLMVPALVYNENLPLKLAVSFAAGSFL